MMVAVLILVLGVGLLFVSGSLLWKVLLFRFLQLKEDKPIPLLETKGQPKGRVWFVAWLAKIRQQQEKLITDDTTITPIEVRAGLVSATIRYGVAIACYDIRSILTVRDFVKVLDAQLTLLQNNEE